MRVRFSSGLHEASRFSGGEHDACHFSSGACEFSRSF